jgi:hypothetical protein
MIYHLAHKFMVGEEYMYEIQEVFNLTLLDTLVTLVGTPLSGSALDNTCIWIDLGILKYIVDQSIDRLNSIVPPRKTLKNILSSTWVIG